MGLILLFTPYGKSIYDLSIYDLLFIYELRYFVMVEIWDLGLKALKARLVRAEKRHYTTVIPSAASVSHPMK